MKLTFDHVAQIVPNITEAVDFYTGLIPEAKVLYQDDSWAFVEASGVKLAFVLKDQHPNHLAWRVSEAELFELAEKYDKEIHPHRDGTRSFYLEAPGGGHIEIITFDGAK
ncbi:MAG: VOC family protein [Armatimonas sp.]